MTKNQSHLRYVFGVLVLIVCCMTSAYAQPPAGSTSSSPSGERRRPGQMADSMDSRAAAQAIAQPLNSVLVRIRFKTTYGYKSESEPGRPGLSSCDVFAVSLANSARPAQEGVLIPVKRPEVISERVGYYFCEFLVSGLALNQDVTIAASIDDQGRWLGGTQPEVPMGYRRVLTDRQRTVTLTQSDPRATMNFEMFYEAIGDKVPSKLPTDSIRSKP